MINLGEVYLRLLKDIDGLSTSNNRLAKPQKILKVKAQRLCSILIDKGMNEPSIYNEIAESH